MKIRLIAALLIALLSLSLLAGCDLGNQEAQIKDNEKLTLAVKETTNQPVPVFSREEDQEVTQPQEPTQPLETEPPATQPPATEPPATEPPATEPPATQPATEERLTAEQVKEIALKHAGLKAEKVTRLRAEFDYDDGVPEYEVEFYHEGTEYDYEIHAITGKIIRSQKEKERTPATQPTQPPATQPPATKPATEERLTAEQVKEIALKHAGLKAEEVTRLRAEFDYDDGVPEYEVEFYHDGTEYDYEIHAITGKIIRSQKEKERTPTPQPTQPPATQPPATEPATEERLTAEQVKEIALKHAGLKAEEVTRLRAEFDYDDGRPEYQVEFRHNGWEYEYEIHAQTGKILDWDKEFDD